MMQQLDVMNLGGENFIIDETEKNENVEQVYGSDINSTIAHYAKVIAKNPTFEKVILSLILFNAAWIGVDVDWNEGEHRGIIPSSVFMVMENLFCIGFTLEIILRWLTYEDKILFFRDPQAKKSNIFDLFLVTMMILEVWCLGSLSDDTHLNQFMLLRLLRLMRLLRISRIFRMVPELGIVVKSLKRAARSVSSTLVLEVGIMYIFGVILTQWTNGHENPCYDGLIDDECFLKELFGSIPKSLVTLMQILVFDDTFSIIRPILVDDWYMGLFLMLFIVLGSWTVLNMLIGIICEIICTGTAEEKMRILELRVKEIFALIDTDGSGTVSRKEFNTNGGHNQLIKLGISRDIVQNAFDFLDCDGSGNFDVSEFMTVIFKLLNPPQSQDIVNINQQLSQIATHMNIQAFNISSSKTSSKRFSKTPGQSGENVWAPHEPPDPETPGLSGENAWAPPVPPDAGIPDAIVEDVEDDPARYGPDVNRKYEPDGASADDLRVTANGNDSGFSGHTPKGSMDSNRIGQNGQNDCSNHPFAPELPSKCQEIEVVDLPLDHMAVLNAHQQAQAQDIFEKLQQLCDSTQKVEEALKLLHETKLQGSSSSTDAEKVDCVLRKAGLDDLPTGDKTEAESLLKQYIALDHQDYPARHIAGPQGSSSKNYSPAESPAWSKREKE